MKKHIDKIENGDKWFEVLAGPGAMLHARGKDEQSALHRVDLAIEQGDYSWGIQHLVGMLALELDESMADVNERVYLQTNGPSVILREYNDGSNPSIATFEANATLEKVLPGQLQLDLRAASKSLVTAQ